MQISPHSPRALPLQKPAVSERAATTTPNNHSDDQTIENGVTEGSSHTGREAAAVYSAAPEK